MFTKFAHNRIQLKRLDNGKSVGGWVTLATEQAISVEASGLRDEDLKQRFLCSVHLSPNLESFVARLECITPNVVLSVEGQHTVRPAVQEARRRVLGLTSYYHVKGGWTPITVMDISPNGLGMMMPEPVRVAETYRLKLEVPGSVIEVDVEIRHVKQTPVGFRAGALVRRLDRVRFDKWQQRVHTPDEWVTKQAS